MGRRTLLLALSLFLPSCNILDVVKPPPKAPAWMIVLIGDTVSPAVSPNATVKLVVQVEGNGGGLARGTPVDFVLPDSTRSLGVRLLLAPSASGGGQDSLAMTTDADGVAIGYVRFGLLAGQAVVRMSVPSLTLTNSVSYDMENGAMRVGLSPQDTTVAVGATFAIGVRGLSLGGALTFVSPVFSSRAPGVATVTPNGQVRAVAAGATYVVVSGVRYPDSVAVTVVP
jgi:hypothetical protein